MRPWMLATMWMCCGAASAADDLAALHWLAGHWRGEQDGRVTEEVWLAPHGDVLLGMNRSATATSASFEWMRIVQDEHGIAFLGSPSGQPPVRFAATAIDAASARFENPDHDFPTFIRYRRVDADGLEACVGDQHREQCWTWRRFHPPQ